MKTSKPRLKNNINVRKPVENYPILFQIRLISCPFLEVSLTSNPLNLTLQCTKAIEAIIYYSAHFCSMTSSGFELMISVLPFISPVVSSLFVIECWNLECWNFCNIEDHNTVVWCFLHLHMHTEHYSSKYSE